MAEAVNHPAHYGGKDNPYEALKVIRAWLGEEKYLGFLRGNSLKYLARVGKKGDEVEDLEKAAFYLGAEIDALTTDIPF